MFEKNIKVLFFLGTKTIGKAYFKIGGLSIWHILKKS